MTSGLVITLVCSLAWAVLDVVRKALAERHDPLTLAALVPCAAALGASVYALFAPDLFTLPNVDVWGIFLLSIVINILANYLFLYSLSVGEISAVIPLLSLTPVLSVIGGWLALGQKLGALTLVGILLVMAGAWKVTATGGGRARAGVAPMLGVVVLWGTVPVFDAYLLKESGWSLNTYLFWAIWMVALPLLIERTLRAPKVLLGAVKQSPLLLLLVIPLAGVALGTQFAAVMRIDVGAFEAIKRAGVFISVLAGGWVFGEKEAFKRLPWVLLIVVGVFLIVGRVLV